MSALVNVSVGDIEILGHHVDRWGQRVAWRRKR
jgi:hypothetical protein